MISAVAAAAAFGAVPAVVAVRAGQPGATATVGLSDQIVLARASVAASSPTIVPFEMLVSAAVVVGASDAAAVQRIEVAPIATVPRSARIADAAHLVEPTGGQVPGLIAYVDERTYPEGGVFWTSGTEKGTVVVTTGGASTLRPVRRRRDGSC